MTRFNGSSLLIDCGEGTQKMCIRDSLSAAITGLFGITEPAIYGVNLRLKKPMICGCIAGAIGGGTVSYTHLDVYKRQEEVPVR